MEVIDAISGGKLTTEYRYHHGYWDGAEREFRGFGMVEKLDSEAFDRFTAAGLHGAGTPFRGVPRKQFAPPTLTRTWFHLGPVGDETGERHELDLSAEYWQGDPPMFRRSEELHELLRRLPARDRADALRALRGIPLRREIYALDGTDREGRPCTVTETLAGLREEAVPAQGAVDRRRVFFPHIQAERTTEWERGSDPMTRITFTGNFDAYGQPRRRTEIGCPRGWRGLEHVPDTPYLALRTLTDYASPGEPGSYPVNRVARTTTIELVNDGSQTAQALAAVPDGDRSCTVVGQVLHFYDGEAFQGLPSGQVGAHGALTRTETLVLTDNVLDRAYPENDPLTAPVDVTPHLAKTGAPPWPAGYPATFTAHHPTDRHEDPTRPGLAVTPLGYGFSAGGAASPFVRGYFAASERRRYDFQETATDVRGLVTGICGPTEAAASMNVTAVAYDRPYALMPVEVRLPAAGAGACPLTTSARYDYRVLQLRQTTDPNGNRTQFAYTPLGLLSEIWVQGAEGTPQGDQAAPSVRFVYETSPFAGGAEEQQQPVSVHTIRRIHHDTDSVVAPAERDEIEETVQFSDGFGRLVQVRTTAEREIFDNPARPSPLFGDAGLPADQATAPAPATAHTTEPGAPVPIVVSGWQVYDNKGRVVERYEPFFSTGRDYVEPVAGQRGAKTGFSYDWRGRRVRTTWADGSEEYVLRGVPGSIAAPDLSCPAAYEPTPWETYTYDPNDNAGRTHPAVASAYRHHWDTPTSVVFDAAGRTILTIQRCRSVATEPSEAPPVAEEHRTTSVYDIRGNLVEARDALGRVTLRQVYDCVGRVLRVESLDAGARRRTLDAAGDLVERRDSKGALVLQTFDALRRPVGVWARDARGPSERLTRRERLVYGDDLDGSGMTREAAAQHNLLGRLHRHYDEAGLLTIAAYDFKGNVVEKSRRTVAQAAVLSLDPGPTAAAASAYRVDWETPERTPLEPDEHWLTFAYDALNRPKGVRYPRDAEGLRRVLDVRHDRAGSLDRLTLDGACFVERIARNAAGQQILIAYGNGLMTRYAYDPASHRLMRLRTERYTTPDRLGYVATGGLLQDLGYTHDLVGNFRRITDVTPGSGFVANPEAQLVQGADPSLAQALVAGDALVRHFDYDSLYQLILATGRESNGIPSPRPCTDDPRGGFGRPDHGPPGQDGAAQSTGGYAESYAYDPAGNLVKLHHRGDGTPAWTRQFGMGGMAAARWDEEWRRRLTASNGWPDAPGNRLTHISERDPDDRPRHDFDSNGNLLRSGIDQQFAWDHADRMRAFRVQRQNEEPSVYAQYLYDAGGQRVMEVVRWPGDRHEITVYVDGIFERHCRHEGNTDRITSRLNVLDDSGRVALLRAGDDSGEAAPRIQYHLRDHIGSSAIVVDGNDSTGNGFVNREEYFPYGETSFGGFEEKEYRFSGKERLRENGLSYHGARYYAPWIGRWVSCDPAGIRDELNLYRYAANNPVSHFDPDGRQEQYYTVERQDVVPVKSRADITQQRVQKIAAASGEWHYYGTHDENLFTCVNWARQYVYGLMTGHVYHPEKGGTTASKGYPGQYVKADVIYDIMAEKLGPERTSAFLSRVFPRPSSGHAGLIDRLTFYPVSNIQGFAEGWYVERGVPGGSYEPVWTTERLADGNTRQVPLQVLSGDVLYSAQGETGSGFDLRHAVFVLIEGHKISLWGAHEAGQWEQIGTDTLTLNLPSEDALYKRRVIIRVWRYDYERQPTR